MRHLGAVDFCVFDHLDAGGKPTSELYDDRLAFAAAVENAGFAGYYIAEHHCTPLGHAPSPSVYIAALSQHTSRMRIGSMVHVLPAYDPLRLAEELCMLDHLSRGRLDIGVGRGASPYEVGMFGVRTQEARDIFEEALAVIRKVMREELPLSHRGEFFKYYDVPVTMRPLQPGGPPIFYGAFSERNLEFAAANRLNITLNGPPPRLRQLALRYRQLYADMAPSAPAPKIASLYQMFVGETDAEANRIAEAAYDMWHGNLTHLWRANNSMPRQTLPANFAAASAMGAFIAGSAETVRTKLQAILDVSSLDRMLLQCNLGNMPHQAALDSLARFQSDVMPHLRSAVPEQLAA